MKNFLRPIALSTALTTLMVAAGAAMAQPTAQTPLSDPVQQSGSVNPQRSSNCGFLPNNAVQNLEVNEDFASLEISVTGNSGITLLIEGSNGFTECFTTDNLSGNSIDAPGLLNRGSYSFYVGNNNQVTTDYTLTIRQN